MSSFPVWRCATLSQWHPSAGSSASSASQYNNSLLNNKGDNPIWKNNDGSPDGADISPQSTNVWFLCLL